MPRKLENAHSILRDPSRPFVVLLQHTPESPGDYVRPVQYDFFDDIIDFHQGSRVSGGRFQVDYNALCKRLKDVVHDLDSIIHNVCLVPVNLSRPRTWHLHMVAPDWSKESHFNTAYSTHHLWYDLYNLTGKLDSMAHPAIQHTHLATLPNEMLAMIVGYLPMNDVRRLMATSRRLEAFCKGPAAKYGKVTFWYNHANIGTRDLRAACLKIGAPATPFGYSLGAFWLWLAQRERSGRLTTTHSLALVNRWTWAQTVYAETAWKQHRLELKAWAVAFYCGILALSCLQTVRLDCFALPYDGVATLAEHPTLTGLHLHGCGFLLTDEIRAMPKLRRIRQFTLGWDPLSAFEVTAAKRFLCLTLNVENLRLYHRSPGPTPLGLGVDWPGRSLRLMQSLSIEGTDVGFAITLLSRCQSTSLRGIKLYLHTTPTNPAYTLLLNTLANRRETLEVLVIQGCPRPRLEHLGSISRTLPHVVDLALLPRMRNQTRLTAHDWVLPSYDVAGALSRLSKMQRFCGNFAVAGDAVGPLYIDTLTGDVPSSVSGDTTHPTDHIYAGRAAALPFFATFPTLSAFTVVDGQTTSTVNRRSDGTVDHPSPDATRPYRDTGEWWQEGSYMHAVSE